MWLSPYLPLGCPVFGINQYLFIKFSAFSPLGVWIRSRVGFTHCRINEWKINGRQGHKIRVKVTEQAVFIGCYGDPCSQKCSIIECSVIDLFNIPRMTLFIMALKSGTKYLLTLVISNIVLFVYLYLFLKFLNCQKEHIEGGRHNGSCIYKPQGLPKIIWGKGEEFHLHARNIFFSLLFVHTILHRDKMTVSIEPLRIES